MIARSCRWATRASAASPSTSGSVTHRPKRDPAVSPLRTKEATMRTTLVAFALLGLITSAAMAQEAKVTSLMSKDLPDIPGKAMLMILVEHPPGGSNPNHRPNAHAILYGLQRPGVMQVKCGQPGTLKPGESVYEGPDDIHVVDRNASKTKPAKFVVVLIKEKGAPALIPVK